MQTLTNKLVPSLFLLLSVLATAGTQANANGTRVVGGSKIDIAAVPATVALLSNDRLASTGSYFQSQFCGGTVIAARWVLSAAHCLVTPEGRPVQATSLSVLAGSTNLEQPLNQPIGVTRVIIHQQYAGETFTNDIALLQLEYDALVTPAALDANEITLNDLAFIAGWGALQQGDDQTFPTSLQGAYVRLVPGASCDELFPVYSGHVTARQVCAGYAAGGVDSCQGDSGGPLYRAPADGVQRMTLVGVTSWGYGCANAQSPGVYTSTRSYREWILANSGISNTQSAPTLVPVTQSLDNPLTAPSSAANSAQLNPSFASGGSGGGALWFMLPLLALYSLGRKNRELENAGVPIIRTSSRPHGLYLCVLSLLSACAWVQQSSAGAQEKVEISLLEQPIGQSREPVIADAQLYWQASAVCTLVKTGFGFNKRAYFLETCTFNNSPQHTFCEATPAFIEYRFFENTLVQMALEFDELVDAQTYRQCALMQTAGSAEQVREIRDSRGMLLNIRVDERMRTVVSNKDLVGKIHLLKSSL